MRTREPVSLGSKTSASEVEVGPGTRTDARLRAAGTGIALPPPKAPGTTVAGAAAGVAEEPGAAVSANGPEAPATVCGTICTSLLNALGGSKTP